MEAVDLREQIVRLEARIEEMTEAAERCRRIGQIARVAIVSGVVWIMAALLGLLQFNATSLVGSITLLIGGVVAYGSNASTWRQVNDGIRVANEQRTALIGQIKLQVVGGTALEPD